MTTSRGSRQPSRAVGGLRSDELVRVENTRSGQGVVIAEFDAVLDGVTIRGARLVKGRNGTYVGCPSRKDRDTDRWYEVVELSDALRARAQAAAENALEVAATEPPTTPF